MFVQVQRITEALDERYGAALDPGHLPVPSRPSAQRGKDGAHEDREEFRSERGIVGHAEAQRERERENPLPDCYIGKHSIDEPSGGVGHATATAGRTEPASLATEADHPVLAAVIAVHSNEAVGQNATFEKTAQFAFDETRHGPALILPAREEGLKLFPYHLIQHDLLGLASAVTADKCPTTSGFAFLL